MFCQGIIFYLYQQMLPRLRFNYDFLIVQWRRKGINSPYERGSLEREVNKHGWAEWQGNYFSSNDTFTGSLDQEVKKKRNRLLLHTSDWP